MSICAHVSGIIEYKKTPKELPFKELKECDENAFGKIKGNIIQFKGYCRASYIAEYFQKYIKDNLENIEVADIYLDAAFDDGPNVTMQVIGGEYFEQWIENHIPPEWPGYIDLADSGEDLTEDSNIII